MICLLVAGILSATLPVDQFTLRWVHSVERIAWEEDWDARSGRLVLSQARVRGSGAGMEPGPDAILEDGWWRWRPAMAPLDQVVLGRSDAVPDHEICWNGICQSLGGLLGAAPRAPVTLVPCG